MLCKLSDHRQVYAPFPGHLPKSFIAVAVSAGRLGLDAITPSTWIHRVERLSWLAYCYTWGPNELSINGPTRLYSGVGGFALASSSGGKIRPPKIHWQSA